LISRPRKPTISIRAIRARNGIGDALGGAVEGEGLGATLGGVLAAVAVGDGMVPTALEGGPETVVTPQAARPAATDPTAMARSIARRVIATSLVTR
jgi:hypothetical protein